MSFTLASINTGKIGGRRAVWKHMACTSQTQVINSGATLDIKTHDAAAGFASTDWLLGSAAVFGYAINNDQFGATLIVSLSADGSNFGQVLAFPIYGEGITSFGSGIELAGGVARFTLVNASGVSTNRIWLEVRAL